MTDQSRLQLTDTAVERMLVERAGSRAPADLIPAIATAVESTGQRTPGLLAAALAAVTSRPGRASGTSPSRRLLQVLTVAVMAIVVVTGAGLILRQSPAVIGGPSGSPSIAPTPSTSVAPSSSPSPAATSSAIPARAPSWTATRTMVARRSGHTATLLTNGRVLVAGGGSMYVLGSSSSAELYDPGSGSWAATGSMGYSRQGSTAVLLHDGRVLMAGGAGGVGDRSACCSPVASAELYDPGTELWTATGKMQAPREGQTATLLPDGKVLVAGGFNTLTSSGNGVSLASAELFDPRTGSWTTTGNMHAPRSGHTATLLHDGRVLVSGGAEYPIGSGPSAEIYDPATGSWTATGSMSADRVGATATLLPDGRVLVAGGSRLSGAGDVLLASAELYDPATGSWIATGSMVTPGGGPATLLPDGRVLVVRGDDGTAAELYDPVTGTWSATASMLWPGGSTATLLPDGRVVVAGGHGPVDGNVTSPAPAELYDPGSP